MRFKAAPNAHAAAGITLFVVLVPLVVATLLALGDTAGAWCCALVLGGLAAATVALSPTAYELRRVEAPPADGAGYRESARPDADAVLVVHGRFGARLRFRLAGGETSARPELALRVGIGALPGVVALAWTRAWRRVAVLVTDWDGAMSVRTRRGQVVVSPADVAAFKAELARVTAT